MYGIIQRFTVQVLRQGGLTQERIREQTGISKRSIRRMGTEPAIVASDGKLSACKESKVGAPSKVAASRDLIVRLLTAEPDMKSVEISFNMVTNRAIRRGSIRSVGQIVGRIEAYRDHFSEHAQPLVWVATSASISAKITRLRTGISRSRH